MIRRMLGPVRTLLLGQHPGPRRLWGGLDAGLLMILDPVSHGQRWLGLSERELHGFARRLSRGVDTAIDVGAADGEYTLFFAARAARRVIAFEPDPALCDRLRANLSLNQAAGLAPVELIQRPAGSRTTANQAALDDLRVGSPAVIKVDVEGAELEVLEGSHGLLDPGRASWIIEVHSPALEQACRRVLEERGYRVTAVGPAWWRRFLPERRPIGHVAWLVAPRSELTASSGQTHPHVT